MLAPLTIGSQAHKELFCRVFTDTHAPYDVSSIHWPTLDRASLERLRTLPFWEEALGTEHATAAKVQAQAGVEQDALLREAVALQGYEEARHSALLRSLLTHYAIPVSPPPLPSYRLTRRGHLCARSTVNVSTRSLRSAYLQWRKSLDFFPAPLSSALILSCRKKPGIFSSLSTGWGIAELSCHSGDDRCWLLNV